MNQAGSIYGQALYDLAREEGLADIIWQQLQTLQQCLEAEPEYLSLLSLPQLPKPERCRLLDESMGNAHPYLLNFMKILAEKGHMRQFFDCFRSYRQNYYRGKNILPVTAVTAIALSPTQWNKLEEKLAAITGKTIMLSNKVDPQTLGGIRLEYDGKQVDDTVAHRLDSVRQLLKNTVL